jgi:membrane protease YdiL (CAAX protease family)
MSNDSSDLSSEIILKPQRSHWVAPFSFVSVVFFFYASQVVAALALYQYGAGRGWSSGHITDWLNNSVWAQFAFLVIGESLLLLAIYALMRFLRWSRGMIGLVRPKAIHILIGLAAVVPYYVLYFLIVAIVSHLVPSLNVDQKQEIGFDNVVGSNELVITFLSLVIIPPIVEEIVMRGFLYSGLKTWLPALWAGLAVSLTFGAAHLAEGGAAGPLWIGAIDTFTLSLILVYLREKTGNLWAGITLHMLKNGLAFVLLFVLKVQ